METFEPVIDGVEILRKIGSGAFSTVFYAKQQLLDRLVAVKVLSTSIASDERSFQRFEREAKISSSIDHPNIAKVFSYGLTEDNRPFLIMEYFEGKTLQSFLSENGALNLDQFIDIFLQLCAALQYAHESGITHRDIKPGNIMIMNDETGKLTSKLLDFGIAKSAQKLGSLMELTLTGEFVGSPAYMSPEQCTGQTVDERSDLYSLACVMYEALTNRPAFSADSAFDLMSKHQSEEIQSLSKVKPDLKLPLSIAHLIYKCLAKDPAHRPHSAMEVAKILQESKAEPVVLLNQTNEKFSQSEKKSIPKSVWVATFISLIIICLIATIFFTNRSSLKNTYVEGLSSKSPRTQSSFGTTERRSNLIGGRSPTYLLNRADEEAEARDKEKALLDYQRAFDVLSSSTKFPQKGTAKAKELFRAQIGISEFYWQVYGTSPTAESLSERCVDYARNYYGQDSYEISQAQSKLADLLIVERKLDKAAALLLQARKTLETICHSDHNPPRSKLAWVLGKLGTVEYMQKRYAEACDVQKAALSYWEEACGPSDDATLWAKSALIQTLYKLGNKNASESMTKDLIELLGGEAGIDAMTCTDILSNLMMFYESAGDKRKAVIVGEKLISALDRHSKENEALLVLNYLKLANLDSRKQSLHYLDKARSILENMPLTQASIEQWRDLARAYLKMGKFEESQSCQAKVSLERKR